jgi:amino acid transporter
MAIWNRKKSEELTPPPTTYADEAKSDYVPGTEKHGEHHDVPVAVDPETKLQRGLKARHITMIAIGGAIGTGLIIGTGAALARAGPASILISYTFVGFLVFIVMAALGEMAAWLPMGDGFAGYAARFCDPALGFALGYVS